MSRKRIIPGNMSMARVRKQNLLFVDKTRYIARLENDAMANALVFVRPLGFGKTTFTALLCNYYDLALKERFSENFAGTWIGAHKTPRASSYCCLCLDFSFVPLRHVDMMRIFTAVLASGLKSFSMAYPDLGLPASKLDPRLYDNPSQMLEAFLDHFILASGGRLRLYVIIDEYDHLANAALPGSRKRGGATAEDCASIRQFYATLKKYFGGGPGTPIERIFMTGVALPALDSSTSGFDIAMDISGRKECAAMAGLTHGELSQVIDETVDFSRLHHLDKAGLMEEIDRQLGGYVFARGQAEGVFNTWMCLDFINDVISSGHLPAFGQGGLISASAQKLCGLMDLADKQAGDEISSQIAGRNPISSALPFALDLNQDGLLDCSQFISLLYRLGFISFVKGSDPAGAIVEYRCPNETCYQIFVR